MDARYIAYQGPFLQQIIAWVACAHVLAVLPVKISCMTQGLRHDSCLLQRFPNKASLAMAVHKELGGGSHSKKKTSRLKRIILRERADKAASQAGIAAEQAIEGLTKSKAALESLQQQLKVALLSALPCLLWSQAGHIAKPLVSMLRIRYDVCCTYLAHHCLDKPQQRSQCVYVSC